MISTFVRRAVAGAGATALLLAVGLVAPASGSPSDDPDLVAVRFELMPTDGAGDDDPLSPAGSDEISHYVEFQVDHGGVSRRLRPLPGPVIATPLVTEPAISVEIDGLRVGSAADGFGSTLGQVFGSASVGSFVRIDTGGVGEPAVVEMNLGRRLEAGDYLLVQEAGGDAAIDIEAIGADGGVIAATRTVGPAYRWKSGHRTPDGTAQWASVIDISDWTGAGDVTGLRVRTAGAELKVLVLEPAVGVIPLPLADAGDGAQGQAGAASTASTAGPMASSAPTTAPTLISPPTSVVTAEPSPAPTPAPTSVPPAPKPTAAPAASSTSLAPPAPVPEEAWPGSGSNPASRVLAQAEVPTPTALAMTGVSTDPWVLVALATGLIFFGYTAVVAFRRPADERGPGEPSGHAQLDALGFD